MNYLNKHNPIGDVDMIRMLERLDSGASAEDIIAELPVKNRSEAEGLLDMVTLLEDARTAMVPPKEQLQYILEHLDAPLAEVNSEIRSTPAPKRERAPWFVMPKITWLFPLQRYFFPVSIAAAVVLVIVGGRFFTASPIGTDAVLYELGTENVSDIFPDDGLLQTGDETPETLRVPVQEDNFNVLVGEGKTTGGGKAAPVSQEQPQVSTKSTSIESVQSPEQFSSTRPASLYGDTFETTIVPLVQNEQLDAYGVFPEDGFSMYLHTLADLPIDNF